MCPINATYAFVSICTLQLYSIRFILLSLWRLSNLRRLYKDVTLIDLQKKIWYIKKKAYFRTSCWHVPLCTLLFLPSMNWWLFPDLMLKAIVCQLELLPGLELKAPDEPGCGHPVLLRRDTSNIIPFLVFSLTIQVWGGNARNSWGSGSTT